MIEAMDTLEWLSAVSQGDSRNMVATKAGLYAATLNKQVARGHLSPEVVVAIARAYDVPVLDGLVVCGLITEDEAHLRDRLSLPAALKEASAAELLREVLERVDHEGSLAHPDLASPLDDSRPAVRSSTEGEVVPMRRRGVYGAGQVVEELPEGALGRAAAHKVEGDAEDEADAFGAL